MQLICLAFVNTVLALILWIFGTYGLIAGLFASVASGGGMWGTLFIWAFVFRWKNDELSEKVRNQRKTLHKKIWKTLFPLNVFYAIKDTFYTCKDVKKGNSKSQRMSSPGCV